MMKKSEQAQSSILMRLMPLTALFGLLLLPTLRGSTRAEGAGEPAVAAANAYIGSKKCESCHDAHASGDQYGAWSEAAHSHAFEVLKSDRAKEVGAKHGIKEPSKSGDCLKCHVTGYGLPKKQFKKSFKPEAGVGCESCHGPGNNHARARFRAANAEDDDDEGFGDEEEEASYTQIPDGEIGTGIKQELCMTCHNADSPTYKPFCFNERSSKVRHLNPLKPRTAKERAAILDCGCGDACKCDGECIEGCGVPAKK